MLNYNQMRVIIPFVTVLAVLLVSSTAMHLSASKSEGQKVKIDLYFQSVCPDSRSFIVQQLKRANSIPHFWEICDFNLYPYGNANRRKKGDTWEIICQHGPKECQGNLLETCALNLYDKYTKAIPFIICLEEDQTDLSKQGASCAKKLGLEWKKINECAQSDTGFQLQLKMADATESLKPQRTHVPWIIVNGKHSVEEEQKAQKDFVAYVCSLYKGPVKVNGCN